MRIAWTTGVVCAALIPLAAFVWQQLDRRPAWVTSVIARADGKDDGSAVRDERRAVDDALHRIGRRPRVSVEVRSERSRRTGDGTTLRAERVIVIRSDAEAPLRAVGRELRGVENTVWGEPRRATRIGDFTLVFVLVAMLLTLATLERSALSDADPFPIDPPLVALALLGLGLLAAGAVVVERAWNHALIPFVAIAFAPIVIWFARAKPLDGRCGAATALRRVRVAGGHRRRGMARALARRVCVNGAPARYVLSKKILRATR